MRRSGVAMVVDRRSRAGGGPLALGVIVGVLFALLGAGRVCTCARDERDG